MKFMLPFACLLSLAMPPVAFASVEHLDEYVGKSLSQISDARPVSAETVVNGLAFSEFLIKGQRVLLLRKGRGASGEVADAMAKPRPLKGESFFPPSLCSVGRHAKFPVFAIASHADGKERHHAREAWQINPKTKRFESANPRNVKCGDEAILAR